MDDLATEDKTERMTGGQNFVPLKTDDRWTKARNGGQKLVTVDKILSTWTKARRGWTKARRSGQNF